MVQRKMCIRDRDTVEVYSEQKRWSNYCFSGEDFKKGTTLLKKGSHIGYVEAAILAGMGVAKVPVYCQPRIVLLTTGDEVVEPGLPLPEGKIYNSNMTMLFARLRELGIESFHMEAVEDLSLIHISDYLSTLCNRLPVLSPCKRRKDRRYRSCKRTIQQRLSLIHI